MADARLLLVEDSTSVRRTLADRVLRPAGYDVLTAADGNEGLVLARDLQPDVILADFQMPGRNGLELFAALRQANLFMPYILMHDDSAAAVVVQALRMGVSDFLLKPFDTAELLGSLERVLREHLTRQIAEHVPVQLLETNRRLEQRLRELDTLVQIGKRVTGQLDLASVLHQVVSGAVTLARAEEGNLLLVDKVSGELYLYASTNKAATGSLRLPVADSLAGRVVQTGEPMVISGQNLQKIKTHYLFRDLIYVPLSLKGTVIGVLGVTNREMHDGFDDHALPLLRVVADFASIAIENARLYTATEKERSTLDAILRDTEDMIIVVDDTDQILFCNPSAQRTFGIECPTCLGQQLQMVIPHHEVVELFEKQARTGRSRSSEIRMDEGERILNAQLTIVNDVGRVVVMQDITHLKELDRIKSDFVTTVSHDLRSPLTAILGYVDLIYRSGPLTEGQEQFAQRIRSSVQSITQLISELLELGKIEAGFDQDRETISLRDIIQDCVQDRQHEWERKKQVMKVQLPERIPPILGHPLRLRQLMSNLLENAIKYTPEGGQITIEVQVDDEFLILHVSDTGIGIPQQDQPFIFDKFYRTDEAVDHYEGTGLGLSIVKSIVEQHDGRIWVRSQANEGTTFFVMLPSYNPDA